MYDLNELQIFAKVAQLGSFTSAAHSLGVPVSMISRKISDLEHRMGLVLIKRTTRKLSLTNEGAYLFERCISQLQEIETAQEDITKSKSEIRGALKITAPLALGRGPFIKFISEFSKNHPGVEVDLIITNEYVDLVTDDIDVAIRFGELPSSNFVGIKLGFNSRILVASSHYIKQRGRPKNPQDLKDHDLILFSSRNKDSTWKLSSIRSKAVVQVKGKLLANNFETANDLVTYGHGIAFLPEHMVSEGIKSKMNERLLSEWSSAPIPVHAIILNRKFKSKKIDVFLNELTSWQNEIWKK